MSQQQKPIVYVVDDDPSVLKSICALVRSYGLTTESFASAQEFLNAYDEKHPGCLVTDIRMYGMTGIELQEKLNRDGVLLPVILITGHAEIPTTVRAIKNGAVTLLEKPCRDIDLWESIGAALEQDAAQRIETQHREKVKTCLASLTPSERAVLDLIVAGQLNKQIARSLGVSIRTVESRRHNIFKKMETDSVAELVKLVLENQHA